MQRLWIFLKTFGVNGLGRRRFLENGLAAVLIVAATACGFATYAAFTQTPPFGSGDSDTVIRLLHVDLVILLLLVSIVAWRIVGLWSGHRRGIAGSRLQVRLVLIFSVLAAVPAIIMTVFSAYFFHFGVQTWFSDKVRTAVNESQAVAEAYLREHQQVMKADVLAMANDLDRQAVLLIGNKGAFDSLMQTQSVFRNLSEALVFDSTGHVLASSGLSFSMEFEELPKYALERADDGEVVLMTGGSDDRVRALLKLNNFVDSYLYVGRMVDAKVLNHLSATREASTKYAELEGHYSSLQVMLTVIFLIVAIILLLAAIWLGLTIARQLVTPIGLLIAASDRVRAGDLSARVPESGMFDEFQYLGKSFNRMTSQIHEQRNELITANRQLDYRRKFTEAVLAGVSSGIIGIDEKNRISLANASAAELFQQDRDSLTGRDIAELMPELIDLVAQACQRPSKVSQFEILYKAKDESRRIFLIRIAVETIEGEIRGAVLTFDDITDIQSTQRKAAWSDVARRIAHEIKNPLTPIQLSAERLRRKYSGQIQTDRDVFEQCIDTIIRHVGDIGRMVNEFSSFARMPEPSLKEENLGLQIRNMLVLHQQAHPEIFFRVTQEIPDGKTLNILCDAAQIRQALTNLIQNAVDSIKARAEAEKLAGGEFSGVVEILVLEQGGDNYAVAVTDNGIGLPKHEDPSRLSEPYVTHKEKGTGLGLAIVKKIMEDHKGRLVTGAPEWLKASRGWTDLGGATFALVLPALPGYAESGKEITGTVPVRDVA